MRNIVSLRFAVKSVKPKIFYSYTTEKSEGSLYLSYANTTVNCAVFITGTFIS